MTVWHEKFLVEDRRLSRVERRRWLVLAATLMSVGGVAFVLILVGVLTQTGFERLDPVVENWFDAHVSPGVTGVMIVLAQVMAPIVQHPRPPIGQMLFGPDRSFSFPSGHVLGTADFVLLLAYLLASRIRRTWFSAVVVVVAVLAILAQIVSRLYLGYHWISDTTASVTLSMVIVGAIITIDVRRTVALHRDEAAKIGG